MPQLSVVLIAIIALTLLMSYTKPAADEPKQYILVWKLDRDKLESAVNEKLAEGWHLQGGVATSNGPYFQAMVK